MTKSQGPTGPQDEPTPPAPAKPPRPKLKRGRRPNALKAPPGAMRRLEEELAASALATQQARASGTANPNAARAQLSFEDDETSGTGYEPMTEAQRKRKRSQELKRQRDEEAQRGAGLLALVAERQAWRRAQEKAAAERKERGVKLSYDEWKREMGGE